VSADVKAAATTDDIVSTLSDRDVRHALETFVGNSSFQLIETLAEQTAALVMTTFGVNWLRLELIKPSRYVGVHGRNRDRASPCDRTRRWS
jgi:7,8-dihydroneopterin aldolase/epimerase/oxygenase